MTSPPLAASRRRRARSLLLALLVAVGLIATGAAAATAQGIEDQIRDSDQVIAGSITGLDREPESGPGRFTYTLTVTVDRVYKGAIDTEEVELTTSLDERRCTPPEAETPQAHVFYLTGAPASMEALACRDIARASVAEISAVEDVLGSGRLPVPAEREPVEFSLVDVAEPVTLTRAAAPGAAMVIVGLFGLILLRRLGARR